MGRAFMFANSIRSRTSSRLFNIVATPLATATLVASSVVAYADSSTPDLKEPFKYGVVRVFIAVGLGWFADEYVSGHF